MRTPPPTSRRARDATLVLIADDVEDTREMYGLYLANAGFGVATAVDGLDAVDKTIDRRPDVVVLDLAMPGLNGFEVAQKLRSDDRVREVSIIAVTAHGRFVDAAARTRWFDRFLTKPCLPEDLASAIHDELRRKGHPPPSGS